jgi:Glycosyltransferase family 87
MKRTNSILRVRAGCFLLAVVMAASMWFYVDRILVGYQVEDAASHQRPRGNLSDLYPRWLGARELLLHHRNPYGDDIAIEIQEGYYGRALDANRPNDPKDQQKFAYPVYVVFLLAPLVTFPFHSVQIFFHWLIVTLTVAGVWLWLRALHWRMSLWGMASAVAITLGCFPSVQGIKIQQPSMLVAAFLAGAVACSASGYLSSSGILLALATIKPQLAWPMVAWLLLWALSDWRVRRRLALAFALMMALLFTGAELILPGWLRMFVDGMRQYHQYAQNQSVLDVLFPWGFAGKILGAAAILASAAALVRLRKAAGNEVGFARAAALVMALTVLVVPMYAPYNQVLLLPALLVLARDRILLFARSQGTRFGYLAAFFALSWQWLAALFLSAAYIFGFREWALRGWWWPGLATFALPVLVLALMLVDVRLDAESSGGTLSIVARD